MGAPWSSKNTSDGSGVDPLVAKLLFLDPDEALPANQNKLISFANISDLLSSPLTIGTTAIASGATTRILYNNAGTLGEYTITGTGTVVAMQTSPTFITGATVPKIIGGTGTTSTLILQPTSGVGATGADIIFNVGNNGATEAMRILNNGNVGIGTASPSEKFEVVGTVLIKPDATWSSGDVAKLYLGDNSTYLSNSYNDGTNPGTAFRMYWGMNIINEQGLVARFGTTYNSLNSYFTGNVGIGTTSPLSTLHIGVAPTSTPNSGLVSLGSGAFDGVTSGFFTGAAAGTLIAGNLASGSSSELINLQKGGVVYLKQDEYGELTNKGGITANYDAGFQLSGGAGGFNKSGSGVQIESANSYTEGVQISLTQFNNFGNGYTNTSGTVNGFQNVVNFKPTSGTAVFNSTVIKPTINQTGGANGISRGLYINPTLTAAADFRAIDVAAGRVLVNVAPTASANYGLVSLGSGAFDGATAGFFTGSSSGTVLAVNAASGYSGDIYNYQINGISKFRGDNVANLFLGAATIGTSGTNTFATKIGTAPTTAPADTIQIFAKDSSAGSANATLGLYLEQAPESGIAVASTHKQRIWINGTEYYFLLTAV